MCTFGLALGFSSCSEIKDGTTDIDSWGEEQGQYVEQTYTLNHPCMLHKSEDIAYVRQHLGQSPWLEGLDKLKNSGFSVSSYQPTPVEYLARLDKNNWGDGGGRWDDAGLRDAYYPGIENNYTNFFKDCAAAYQLALRYELEGDEACAEASKQIINAWAMKNKGLLLGKKQWKGEVIDPNEYLILFQVHQVANAAELLRGYKGWGDSQEFQRVQSWLLDYFYPFCSKFLKSQGGKHSWMNWDLASLTAMLSIGILSDRQDIINEAILYFKQGKGPGCIAGQGVVALFDDPSGSGEPLAQGNESGRDQGHNTLCAALLGTFCQMAYNIGEDLFKFQDYRAVAFAQYVAKYNYVKKEKGDYTNTALSLDDFQYEESTIPFTTYSYCDQTMTKISQEGRGTVRPGWDVWAAYCKAHGLRGKYVTEMAERFRPDGGGGHYGANSGGFDQLGFSTLMYYRE